MTSDFLQREPDAADRERWRSMLAEIPAASGHEGRIVLFVFRVGGERCGLEPAFIELVEPMPGVHSVPHRGAELAGVVNVRGTVTLCFSLAAILDPAPGPASERPMMVVLAHEGWRVACRADEALGVFEFERSALLPAPSTLQATGRAVVKAIFPSSCGDVCWLDAAALFGAFDAAAR